MYVVRDVCWERSSLGGGQVVHCCFLSVCLGNVFFAAAFFLFSFLGSQETIAERCVLCWFFLFLAVARKGRLFLLQNQRSPEIETAPDGAPAGGFSPKGDPRTRQANKSQPSPHPQPTLNPTSEQPRSAPSCSSPPHLPARMSFRHPPPQIPNPGGGATEPFC